MFSILLFMLAGVVLGYLFRHVVLFHKTEKTISITILFLLFFFGLNIGANRSLIHNFSSFGLQALLLAIAGLCGSLIMSWITYRLFFKRKEEKHEK